MKGSSILYCHPERAKDIKPHKYVLSVLQSITLSIPMQQGKARSHGKGTREKGARERGGRLKLFYLSEHRTAQKGTHRINV